MWFVWRKDASWVLDEKLKTKEHEQNLCKGIPINLAGQLNGVKAYFLSLRSSSFSGLNILRCLIETQSNNTITSISCHPKKGPVPKKLTKWAEDHRQVILLRSCFLLLQLVKQEIVFLQKIVPQRNPQDIIFSRLPLMAGTLIRYPHSRTLLRTRKVLSRKPRRLQRMHPIKWVTQYCYL